MVGVDVRQLLNPILAFHATDDYICLSLQKLFLLYIQSECSRQTFVTLATPIIARLLAISPGIVSALPTDATATQHFLQLGASVADECLSKLEHLLVVSGTQQQPSLAPSDPRLSLPLAQVSEYTVLPSSHLGAHLGAHLEAHLEAHASPSPVARIDQPNPPPNNLQVLEQFLKLQHVPAFPALSLSQKFPPFSLKLSKIQRELWSRVLKTITSEEVLRSLPAGAYVFPSNVDRYVFSIVFPFLHGRTMNQTLSELRYFLRNSIETNCSWNPKKLKLESNLVWTTEAQRTSCSRISRTLLTLYDRSWVWLAVYHPKETFKKDRLSRSDQEGQ